MLQWFNKNSLKNLRKFALSQRKACVKIYCRDTITFPRLSDWVSLALNVMNYLERLGTRVSTSLSVNSSHQCTCDTTRRAVYSTQTCGRSASRWKTPSFQLGFEALGVRNWVKAVWVVERRALTEQQLRRVYSATLRASERALRLLSSTIAGDSEKPLCCSASMSPSHPGMEGQCFHFIHIQKSQSINTKVKELVDWWCFASKAFLTGTKYINKTSRSIKRSRGIHNAVLQSCERRRRLVMQMIC